MHHKQWLNSRWKKIQIVLKYHYIELCEANIVMGIK